ncbi:MAG: pyrophosphate phosphatase, partial [Frankiales bacterium]|nr:pyrophosphate phosphatase [Frankiales bacterium]
LLASEAWKRRAANRGTTADPGPEDGLGTEALVAVGTAGALAANESDAPLVAELRNPDVDEVDHTLSRLPLKPALIIGSAQILALAPGISRSGSTMATGLLKGLSHEAAARFSFLLATPVILAAGVLKVPDLMGPLGNGIRGQVLLGSLLSGLGAYVSVRFLSRYFENRSLKPFAWYCLIGGAVALVLVNR